MHFFPLFFLSLFFGRDETLQGDLMDQQPEKNVLRAEIKVFLSIRVIRLPETMVGAMRFMHYMFYSWPVMYKSSHATIPGKAISFYQ